MAHNVPMLQRSFSKNICVQIITVHYDAPWKCVYWNKSLLKTTQCQMEFEVFVLLLQMASVEMFKGEQRI